MDNPLINKEQFNPNNETVSPKTEFSDISKKEQEKNEITEKQQDNTESIIKKTKSNLLVRSKKDPRDIPIIKDNMALEVEKILEEGLKEQYDKMSPVAQQEFKLKGEQTAYKIRDLLQKSKIKVKKIFKLITDWLSLLPGVNKFFLEQEAKIKTDQIITINKQDGY